MVLMLLDWSHTFQNLATQGVTYTSRKDLPRELVRNMEPGAHPRQAASVCSVVHIRTVGFGKHCVRTTLLWKLLGFCFHCSLGGRDGGKDLFSSRKQTLEGVWVGQP